MIAYLLDNWLMHDNSPVQSTSTFHVSSKPKHPRCSYITKTTVVRLYAAPLQLAQYNLISNPNYLQVTLNVANRAEELCRLAMTTVFFPTLPFETGYYKLVFER